MLKRILMVAGVFIIGIVSFNLLYKQPLKDTVDTVIATKEKQQQTAAILEKVTEELHPEYRSFIVSSNSDKEVVIHVWDDEDYFNSVKTIMESITKDVIKSSPLEEHTVVVKRVDSSFLLEPEEDRIRRKALMALLQSLREGLQDYEIGDIETTQDSVSIHTTIKGSGKEAQKLAKEIEEKAISISEELNLAVIDAYKIKILNTKGKILN